MKSKSFIMMIIIFSCLLVRFIFIRYINYDYYIELYDKVTTKYVYSINAPRGRIIDRNGNILVDNKKVNVVMYRKSNNISIDKEIDIAYSLIDILGISDIASDDDIKKFYILTNDTKYLLSNEEINDCKYRRLSDNDIYKMKIDRIDVNSLDYNMRDKVMIYIYYLLNKGYYYDSKVILDSSSDNICASIYESNIEGVYCDYRYERINNYNTLYDIFGSVGYIDSNNKDYYLDKGYMIDDIVGISGLESYYEDILVGKRSKYKVLSDNSLELVSDEEIGDDLVLNLDIDIQLNIEKILKDKLIYSRGLKKTDYFNTAYVVMGDINGNIVALSGMKIINKGNNYIFKDVTIDIFTSSFVVGSVIKGASNTVGYLYNGIDVGKKINDSCIKLSNVPEKCSYKRLGYIDDISALKTSSNYYQFNTAINILGKKYSYNMKLNVSEDDFNKYRNIYSKYGLGSSSGIDFPKEFNGIQGDKISDDLYLNLVIGQYDTYSILGLLSYINTLSNNGIRYKLNFKKDNESIIDRVELDSYYYDRIKKGFYDVLHYGTGRGYVDYNIDAIGKTGTSEVYLDSNTTLINSVFTGVNSISNPKYSLVVVCPSVSYEDEDSYSAPVSRLITRSITDIYFK